MLSNPILETIKKPLGLADDYEAFDQDLIIHINSALMTLEQVGLPRFFLNTGSETWAEYLLDYDGPEVSALANYIALHVKRVFDPPQNSFTTNALNAVIEETLWRINIQAESEV